MAKREKKNRERVAVYYNLDNTKDVALLSLLKRAYKHSNLEDIAGLSLGGFVKFLVNETLLQIEVQAQQEVIAKAEEAASEEPRQTEQPSE